MCLFCISWILKCTEKSWILEDTRVKAVGGTLALWVIKGKIGKIGQTGKIRKKRKMCRIVPKLKSVTRFQTDRQTVDYDIDIATCQIVILSEQTCRESNSPFLWYVDHHWGKRSIRRSNLRISRART